MGRARIRRFTTIAGAGPRFPCAQLPGRARNSGSGVATRLSAGRSPMPATDPEIVENTGQPATT